MKYSNLLIVFQSQFWFGTWNSWAECWFQRITEETRMECEEGNATAKGGMNNIRIQLQCLLLFTHIFGTVFNKCSCLTDCRRVWTHSTCKVKFFAGVTWYDYGVCLIVLSSSQYLRVKVSNIPIFTLALLHNTGNITKEAGPVSMTFTIPMYNPSRLQVKLLLLYYYLIPNARDAHLPLCGYLSQELLHGMKIVAKVHFGAYHSLLGSRRLASSNLAIFSLWSPFIYMLIWSLYSSFSPFYLFYDLLGVNYCSGWFMNSLL